MNEGGIIQYDVKEILERIDSRVAAVGLQLEAKADRATTDARLLTLERTSEVLNRDRDELRAELHDVAKKLDGVQKRLLTFAFSIALSAIGVALTIVLTAGGHS